MPKPQPIDPGHRIDPSHNGDGRALQPPSSRDGRPVTQKPLQDSHGRTVAPDRGHVGRIDQGDIHKDLHGVQDHWDAHNHGYDWHSWNGWNVCHHYDEFGYHWWGFYIGDVYFWTRFYNDGYWWWDPYWHRWVWLRDGQWWWQDDAGVMYLYADGVYYQYNQGDGGVVMTPDPTPPVDVPPGDPAPVNQTTVYSQDGTRSVQISGDNNDAYLYDLTVADPNSPAAQGKWLASGVVANSVVFVKDGLALNAVDSDGNQQSLMFDLDGNPLGFPPAQPDPTPAAARANAAIQTLQQKFGASGTFQNLKSGFGW